VHLLEEAAMLSFLSSQDAWARFKRAVDAAVKSGPQHRTKLGAKGKTIRTQNNAEGL
jgi:hypothetical protein